MTTRNKRKLAALNKENCEEHPRSNLAQNSSAPRSQEDYITQVSEEIEGRVTKRLSKEFSRTENRILGALAWLDDFLMNPLLPGGSGTTPEPTRNASGINQGTNEDDSQNDPHPEASLFHGQREQNPGTERDYDTHDASLPAILISTGVALLIFSDPILQAGRNIAAQSGFRTSLCLVFTLGLDFRGSWYVAWESSQCKMVP